VREAIVVARKRGRNRRRTVISLPLREPVPPEEAHPPLRCRPISDVAGTKRMITRAMNLARKLGYEPDLAEVLVEVFSRAYSWP